MGRFDEGAQVLDGWAVPPLGYGPGHNKEWLMIVYKVFLLSYQVSKWVAVHISSSACMVHVYVVVV